MLNDTKYDLYKLDGSPNGDTLSVTESIPNGYYRMIVHIWIYNSKNQYLIQKRASTLSWEPNKWATTGGSVWSGEYDLKKEAYRELHEELGLNQKDVELIFEKLFPINQSLIALFIGKADINLNQIEPNDEVAEVRWATVEDIKKLKIANEFVNYSPELDNFVFEYKF